MFQVEGSDDNISVLVTQQIEGHSKIFVKNVKIMFKENAKLKKNKGKYIIQLFYVKKVKDIESNTG